MQRPLLIIAFLIFACAAIAQRSLYLKKVGSTRFLRYRVHEDIKFQLKDQDNFTTGQITSLTDSSFVVHETEILLADINSIDIRNKSALSMGLRGSGNTFFMASILLPLADFTNRTVVSGEEASMPHESVMVATLGLVSLGIACKVLAPKVFEIGPKRKLVVINEGTLSNGLQQEAEP